MAQWRVRQAVHFSGSKHYGLIVSLPWPTGQAIPWPDSVGP